MRFWQAISILLASFTIANAANVPVRQRDSSQLLGKRQVVQANICATVGPLSIPGVTIAAVVVGGFVVTPAITIASVPIVDRICLCTEGGVLTDDSIARLTTSFNVANGKGLLTPLLGVAGNTVTTLLNGLLGRAQTDVNNSGGKCTTTIPPNGFPVCPAANAAAGSCAFGCDTGFKICGTGCIPTAQTCPSAARRRSLNNRNICAIGWSACPVQTAKGETVYECVNTSSDLESCGGCPGLANAGVDCSTLPGVGTVTCVEGQCKVHNCMRGFTTPTESGCTAKLARLSSGVTFQ